MSTREPIPPTAGSRLALLGTALHGVLLVGLFVVYVVYVPGARKTCDEFGLTLSERALSAIKLSNWVSDNWWLVLPAFAPAAVANVLVIRALGRGGTRRAPLLWILGVAAVLVAFAAATVLTMEQAMSVVPADKRR